MSHSSPLIAVSQRVYSNERGEPHDALDQRWFDFLDYCGLTPILIPNHPATVKNVLTNITLAGVLLTGGNSLVKYGGDAPARDETETILLKYAQENRLPVLGVCRGMQVIQDYYGVPLERVRGHVLSEQVVEINRNPEIVNSFHDFGTYEMADDLDVWAKAEDGLVKAIRHKNKPVTGIMWHPERISPFSLRDVNIFNTFFKGDKCTV
ncbi:MAG: gamma-glutamyl-gamma-aminobutyrate hydrolase family protein [Alphaproteobacteria bacterium]